MNVTETLTQLKNSTAAVNAQRAKENMGKTELDGDAFLQLMMIQLQNQDPTNPMNSDQFLAQQAQFTQVQELQSLNKNLSGVNEMMQASSLIGKDVTLEDPDNPLNSINGIVTEAQINADGAAIVINDTAYPLSKIQSVKDATTQATGEEASS